MELALLLIKLLTIGFFVATATAQSGPLIRVCNSIQLKHAIENACSSLHESVLLNHGLSDLATRCCAIGCPLSIYAQHCDGRSFQAATAQKHTYDCERGINDIATMASIVKDSCGAEHNYNMKKYFTCYSSAFGKPMPLLTVGTDHPERAMKHLRLICENPVKISEWLDCFKGTSDTPNPHKVAGYTTCLATNAQILGERRELSTTMTMMTTPEVPSQSSATTTLPFFNSVLFILSLVPVALLMV